MFAAFVPWIVYWVLVGNVSFGTAVVVAFALTVLIAGSALPRGRRLKVLEVGGVVVFAVLLGLTFLGEERFLERWIQPLTNAGLFAISLTSLLVGRPFTLEYAREQVPPDVARMPGFQFINRVLTAVWVAAFGVMTLASFVPPLVQGEATIRDGGSTLSIVGYWVIPFLALGLAAVFTGKFPDWFVGRLQAPPPETRETSVPPAPPPADRPRAGELELHAEPRRSLVDEPLALSLRGADPDETVSITATTVDATGHAWSSRMRFVADQRGVVDLARQAPTDGSYRGVDPTGPIWSMRPEGPEEVGLFIPPSDAQALTISAEAGGGNVVLTVARRGAVEGVTSREVRERDVVGLLFAPPGPGPHPGVALFPGSEGGLYSQAGLAALLASRGYAALVVGYFGVEGAPEHLVEVPLERLAAGIRWLADLPEVAGDRVGAVGTSKGAEGLLAAASHADDLPLGALVAISPSHVAWQAVSEDGPAPDASSWTFGGRPLPYAPLDSEALMPQLLRNAAFESWDRRRHRPTLLHLAVGYDLHGNPEEISRAILPVERIAAPILCLSGDEDEVWPSSRMSKEVLNRRPGGAAAGDHHQRYPSCGHLIRYPYVPTTGLWTSGIAFGGTPEGLAAAQADAWPRILGFLDKHLGGRAP